MREEERERGKEGRGRRNQNITEQVREEGRSELTVKSAYLRLCLNSDGELNISRFLQIIYKRISITFEIVKSITYEKAFLKSSKVIQTVLGLTSDFLRWTSSLVTLPSHGVSPLVSCGTNVLGGSPGGLEMNRERDKRGVLISEGGMYRLQWSWDLKMCPY